MLPQSILGIGTKFDPINGMRNLANGGLGVGVCASRTEHEHQPYSGSIRKAKTILMHVMLLGIEGADMAAWVARISVDYRRIYLGYFTSAEEAARAYDTAAQQYFGEFAKLNFPNR